MASFCEVVNIQDTERDILNDIISQEHLEVKFGGTKYNITEYWPPVHHTPPQDSIDDEDLGKLRFIPFYIYDDDYLTFKQNYIPGDIKIQGRNKLGLMNFKSSLLT